MTGRCCSKTATAMDILLDTCTVLWAVSTPSELSGTAPPPFHADPADRIIVATARIHGLTVLTADTRILAYPHVRAAW